MPHLYFHRRVLLAITAVLTWGPYAQAANDAPSISGSTATFSGNQSTGITRPNSNPAIVTINVNGLNGAITPASGSTGISLTDGSAANLTINSGVANTPVTIQTGGNNAYGIQILSVGSGPSNPPVDPFLGVVIPTASNAAGGIATVNSFTNITTSGQNAYGIYAQSSTSGYPQSVIDGLNTFTGLGFTFNISKAFNADGSVGTVGAAAGVQATLVDANGNSIPGSTGKVTVNANGTFSPVAGTGFDSLTTGQSVHVALQYEVTGTSPVTGHPTETSGATIILTITKTAGGFTTTPVGSSFTLFGGGTTAFPDLFSYVHSLASNATAGGAGNTVNVTSNGTIRTTGAGANGIDATSQGGRGGDGRDASVTHSSTQGGDGSKGGNVNVAANGTIIVSQANTVGVLAYSTGGDGGSGGDSGFARNSKDGGAGATGGGVSVTGNGIINTNGLQSTGILALSSGGNGGNGGDGGTTNGASNGGAGGEGGTVDVNGSWTITTVGDQAHGIWAKSLGGYAGSGGGGGWTGTSSGSGGVGTDGGTVTIFSDGHITTNGLNAYGIYGESVGGFGGGGGSGSSIFYASGGSGTSAGSGGSVNITNGVNGVIRTNMADSHGIFGQSIGGGGGSGGGGGVGLATVGGSGSTGGNGGSVTITNNGMITTFGSGSKGIYAQSIGGGGGDGGDSVGLSAVGGSGSATSAGGNVAVINTGNIYSTSNAIFAQSIGGGGGNGGSSTGWFSFGGSGGSGGDAGTVTVSSSGALTTTERNASAIFAQSLGGGGGNGGNSTAVGVFGSLAIGGNGSKGGDGKAVIVGVNATTNAIAPVTGEIRTSGDYARGIQAQSIGGGGGNGGYAFSGSISPGSSISVGIGGSGAMGGNAGTVEVLYGDATSSITTSGQAAHGIFAQSVGGGGGSGGFSIAATAGAGFNAAISMGGDGGGGGNASAVNVGTAYNYTGGSISTSGDHSNGIFAQSVGGGGGDGGFSVAGTVSAGGFAGGSFSFGGKGSAGGTASNVDIFSATQVLTTGINSHGIVAQSIGGGGGSGGFSIAGTVSTGVAMGLSVGGNGGLGGDAGNVTVHSTGLVQTNQDRSYGILAQSIGGSGGDGGFSIAAGVSAGPSLGLSMGGKGNTAGDAGTVLLANSGTVTTDGNDAHALFAQSVGGGGGSGGFSVAASVSIDPTGSGAAASVNASIGGAGGAGGGAQMVTVTSNGLMLGTMGDHSNGILAQSIGGGGGDGGFSIGGSISTGPAVSFSMGGAGSKGGAAGEVRVDSSSNITTYGGNSAAIVGQSVGGGGGNGGFSVAGSISVESAGVGVSIGGAGDGGGEGANVTVGYNSPITGQIYTFGDHSDGIVAQSIGGGGGHGGFSVAADVSSSAAVGFTMGGAGGTASNGGTVILLSGASIMTSASDSVGLFAQSIGGGGGDGGFSIGAGVSASSGAVTASIGGQGGAGGNGGAVTLSSSGTTIITGGDRSDGILAQSIGGGGGNGGFSIGAGASEGPSANFSMGGDGDKGGLAQAVHIDSSSNITTYGSYSAGIFGQSVGGGGGNGGFSVAGSFSATSAGVGASIGGSGLGGGNGGDVTVGYNNLITGQIYTYGDHSDGVVAQSIGGGGGHGGFSVAADVSSSAAIGFTMGGAGGTASNGGTVTLHSGANITTTDTDSVGLFAQSVGGGGGDGGFSVGASISDSSGALTASIGGYGGAGGTGGAVNLTSTGSSIVTGGDRSDGILAQSIGGGGGNGGFSIGAGLSEGAAATFSMGGSGDFGGIAGTVHLDSSSNITTYGSNSSGIFAQSVGGGGGNGGFSVAGSFSPGSGGLGVSIGGSGLGGGKGGDVTVGFTDPITGQVVTYGDHSYGVVAQSIGGGGGNGGFSVAADMSSSAAVTFTMGGAGGTASGGGLVRLLSGASVYTVGDYSHALFAQSVGGGGGDGGFSIGASLSDSSAAVSASVGGYGGKGGSGGNVMLTSSGTTISTSGDHSDGILAQSIGGGGGEGGFSIVGGIGQSTSLNVGVGGTGGSGGNAGLVTVENGSAIYTMGQVSYGLFAQSVGGGGGDGGFSLTGSISTEGNGIGVSIGGSGGAAGAGNIVTVANRGDITTGGLTGDGKGSYGIFAQSVGGGGGSGGFSGSFVGSLGKGNALSVSVGGFGGAGGSADAVNVLNSGLILTSAADSTGIFAQSVGGGGGDGGFSLSAALATEEKKASVSVSIGGFGGAGGDGSTVTVLNSNEIETLGDHSQGILAQSIGGSGGNGGFSIATNLSGGDEAKGFSASIGGSGGTAGDAAKVSVTNNAAMITGGADSAAIFAQSIGGGGGNGGFSVSGSLAGTAGKSLSVSVGGMGSGGGKGGIVEVLGTSGTNDLTTFSDRSDGIFAQSVGGSGGNGGFAASVALGLGGDDVEKPSTSISVAVGGTGGSGNTGGTVNIGTSTANRLTGAITTTGADSVGIFAQSVGGGGGTGGFALSGAINLAANQEGPNTDVAISVGGGGGTGNDGGAVNVYHTGAISTDGDGAHGIQAQSVGGGGGSGGDARSFTLQLGAKPPEEEKEAGAKNKSLSLAIGGSGQGGGSGGIVTVDNVGNITTSGGDAYGIFAQSIGGGGGNGGDGHQGFDGSTALRKYDRSKFTKNLKVVVGGSGGSSGDGNIVNITNTGAITTYGDGSRAVFAQSIGGGGGAGGAGVEGATGTIGVGGGTGSTGNGGAVNITINGSIDTFGNAATGIFAQSVGGGGGAAGDVDRGLKNYLNIGTGLAFGQGSGSGGDGGAVTVISNANITTRGTGADGILAQSVGGGGGVGGSLGNDFPVLSVLNFAGSTGGAGSGGLVKVTQVGNIITMGDGSDGIFAQSAGGQGTGGFVIIDVTGNVAGLGDGSDGIFAQSVGQGGQNNITVTVNSGIVQGGLGTGSGVRFADGKDNQLTNHGTVQTAAGMSGTSIFGTAANENIDNFGTVNDSIDLGTGTNTFNNKVGALLQSGDYIKLGAGNTLYDAGTISPGGLGAIQTTNLTGNFALTGDARWTFDLTPSFSSDLFAISGSANLGNFVNRVDLNELGIATTPGTYTLITAASGLTGKFQFGSFTGGTMPIGFTFDLVNSATQEQLTLTPSTGPFYWRGTVDSAWNGSFVDGQDNWTRDAAGNTFIFGTPGVACDVFFASTNATAGNLNTTLGANFIVNSLTFDTPSAVGIAGNNLLTLAASGGQGLTVAAGSGTPTITAYLELGADQTWTNLSTSTLQIFAPVVFGTSQKLTIDGTGNTNITSVIQTGTGSLTKNGTGTLFLSGASTYGGGTILNGGTLNVDVASVPSGAAPSMSPVLTGPLGIGLLTINGATLGTSTFSGTNTAHSVGNDVLVNANFSVSNIPAIAATAPVSSIDGGVLNSRTGGLFYSDGVNFAGNVFLNRPGVATVITTNSGFLDFTGSIHDLNPGKGGGLTFAGNTVTYLGSGGAAARGLSQIAGQLDASNTYAGTTTVASGVLILGKNNGALAIPGNLTIDAGAYVQFDGANSVKRIGALGVTDNQIATNATVINNGTFDIAGINQTIAALYGNGIVRLDDSRVFTGTGVGTIGILTVGSGNFSGTILGTAPDNSLVKFGSGKLILTGISTFPGGTFVQEGSLAVNGAIFSEQTLVYTEGTLQGSGWVYGNVLNNGTVSPGNSPGTLHIAENYKQMPSGTLKIEIAGNPIAQHDLLQVNGRADLSGTLQLVRLNNFKLHRGESVVFLTASQGVSGRFDLVINPFTSKTILEPSVVYDDTSVAVELVQGSFEKFARSYGLTPNQHAVSWALDSAVRNHRADAVIDYLDGRALAKLPADFDKIAPEELTSIFTIGTSLAVVQSQNIQRRNDDIRSGANGFSAAGLAVNGSGPSYSGSFGISTGVAGPNGNEVPDGKASESVGVLKDDRWGVFLSGTGEWVSVGDNYNARGYDLTSGGFTLGVDYKVAPHLAIGIAAGYTGTTADLSDRGRVWVNGGKIGLYATTFTGGWYADAAVFGGYNSYDTRRSALQGEARGSAEGGELNALFGTGYDFHTKGGLTFGPTASFNYTYVGLNGFQEQGSLAPLNIHGGKGESVRTAFGLKASYDWKIGSIHLKPELRAAWQHEYGDAAYSLDSNFASGAGNSFLVNGPPLGRDSVLLGAGFALQLSERTSTYLYYDGDLGRKNYQSTNVTGGLRVSF